MCLVKFQAHPNQCSMVNLIKKLETVDDGPSSKSSLQQPNCTAVVTSLEADNEATLTTSLPTTLHGEPFVSFFANSLSQFSK